MAIVEVGGTLHPVKKSPMRVIETRFVRVFFAAAMTFYPFVLIRPGLTELAREAILKHENVHWEQQRSWYKRAWLFGLAAWYFLYLMVLPFFWNRWRRRWETEAYRLGQGYTDKEIADLMRRPPYYLLW